MSRDDAAGPIEAYDSAGCAGARAGMPALLQPKWLTRFLSGLLSGHADIAQHTIVQLP